MHHKQDNLPNTADPIASSKNNFWDFISFENDAECEETTRMKNHDELQKMAPHRKRSYIFDSQPKRIDIVDSEEKFKEILEKDSQENLSLKMDSARYQISKGNTMKEKPKILRLNMPNRISSHDRSMKTSINEQISYIYPTEKSKYYKKKHKKIDFSFPSLPFSRILFIDHCFWVVPADVSTIILFMHFTNTSRVFSLQQIF